MNIIRSTLLATMVVLGSATGCTPAGAQSAPPSAQSAPAKRPFWDATDVAFVFIDYQPEMFALLKGENSPKLVEFNVTYLAKVAEAFKIPVVLSTVGVGDKVNTPRNSRPSAATTRRAPH